MADVNMKDEVVDLEKRVQEQAAQWASGNAGTLASIRLAESGDSQQLVQPMVSEHSGEAAYALGMIDILEGWSSGWHAQAVILGFICKVIGYPGNARGITAVHPNGIGKA